ncbi:MAG: TatD family hydrolase [Verrucomicrobia bacterium]|nr:TatD family hydrolase [Verrucomicrobiota bacterium]
MAVFYDTHSHLTFPDFQADLPEVIERAQAAEITRIICVGTDLESSRSAVRLSEQHPGVFAVVGWHPNHVTEAPEDIRSAFRELAVHPKVVAIGETGLDYYRMPSTKGGTAEQDAHFKQRQAALFRQQLEVAAECGLNVVVHQRGDVFEATMAELAPFAGRVRAVFHCFAGDGAALRRVLDLDGMVSFTGILTFKNGQNVRDALAAAPMRRFMLETDCPFLAPVPYRGKRCEPAFVKETSETAAQVKGCSLEELSAATCAAAQEFFPKLS